MMLIYAIKNKLKTVQFMKKKLTCTLAFFILGLSLVFSQTPINGLVVDETGEPIIGATIQVKDAPSVGTITDFNGTFRINTTAGNILVISYVGMKTPRSKCKCKYASCASFRC